MVKGEQQEVNKKSTVRETEVKKNTKAIVRYWERSGGGGQAWFWTTGELFFNSWQEQSIFLFSKLSI